jgi:hypothetical protein
MKKLDAFDARHQGRCRPATSVMNRSATPSGVGTGIPSRFKFRNSWQMDGRRHSIWRLGENDRYERTLQRLAAADREAVIGRIRLRTLQNWRSPEQAVGGGHHMAAAPMKRLAGEMQWLNRSSTGD